MLDIPTFQITEPKPIKTDWLHVTPAEAQAYLTLPGRMRVERWKKDHAKERCGECNKFIGNHSLKMFAQCALEFTTKFEKPWLTDRAEEQ